MHLDLKAISCMHPISYVCVQSSPHKKVSSSMHNPCYLVPLRGCNLHKVCVPYNDNLKLGVKFSNMVCGIVVSNEFMFIDKWHFLSFVNEKTMIENIVILFENESKRFKKK